MKRILLLTVMCVLGLFGTLRAQDVVSILGTTTNSKYDVPVETYQTKSASQSCYTAEEIGMPTGGTIDKIAFNVTEGAETRNVKVWLRNTENDFGYGNYNTITKMTDADLVYDGSVSFASGWTEIDLTTDFEYTGTNLLVTIFDYTNARGGDVYFNVFSSKTVNAEQALYKTFRKTGGKSDPTVDDNVTAFTKYDFTPQIQLTFAGGAGSEGEGEGDGDDSELKEVLVNVGADKSPLYSSNYNLPIYDYSAYSMTQQVYTEEEIGFAGKINSVSFRIGSGTAATRTLEVYLQHTDLNTLGGNTVAVDASNKVFDGSVEVGAAETWFTVEFDTPFDYTGGNLLLCVNDKTGVANEAGYHQFYRYTVPSTRGTQVNGSYQYDATQSYTIGWNGSFSYVNQIQLGMSVDPTPTAPQNLVATVTNSTSVALSWNAVGVAESYNVYNGEDLVANVEGTTYTVEGLTVNENYCFTVTSVNEVGESAASTQTCATPVLAAPTNLTATATSSSSITLSWYDAIAEATSYNVYNGADLVANVEGTTTYKVEGLTAETNYCYTVTAVKGIESAASDEACATTLMVAPETPANLVATAVDHETITLTWDAVETAESYYIYNGENFVMNVAETTCAIGGLAAETEYCFTVTAVNNGGESAASGEACATTEEFTGCYVVFTLTDSYGDGWNGNKLVVSYGASSQELTLTTGKTATYTLPIPADAQVTLTYTVTGSYTYPSENGFTVAYEDGTEIVSAEEGSLSATVIYGPYVLNCEPVAPNAPVLKAEVTGESTIVLTWAEVGGAKSYKIYQGSDLLAENLTETSYLVEGLDAETQYCFTAIAVNEVGESELSEEVCVTTYKEGTQIVQIGDGEKLGYYAPISNYGGSAKYSITQQIYLQDEINSDACDMVSISFQNYYGGPNTRNIAVYMTNIDKDSFVDGKDWVEVSDENLVYQGEHTFGGTAEWTTIVFQTPFVYEGGNVCITVNDLTGEAKGYSGYDAFYWTPTTTLRGLYATNNSAQYNCSDIASITGYTVGNYNYSTAMTEPHIANIRITTEPGEPDVKVDTESIAFGSVRLGEYWTEREETTTVNVKAILTTVTSIECDNEFFTLSEIDYEANPISFTVSCDKNAEVEGEISANIVITYTEGEIQIPVTATAYTPASPDIYELVQNAVFAGGLFEDTPDFANLHDDYVLPKESVDGNAPDAVYYFELEEEIALTVDVTGTNAIAAIYKAEDLEGNGPSKNNNYKGNLPEPDAPKTFFYDFNDGNLEDFNLLDQDGDGNNWKTVNNSGAAVEYIISYSWGTAALTPDNYIVTKEPYAITETSKLSYKCMTGEADRYGIYVSEDGENFTLVFEEVPGSWNTWYDREISLEDYTGVQYIAVRHFNSDGKYNIAIDDLKLTDGNEVRGETALIDAVPYPAGKYYLVAAAEDAFTVTISGDIPDSPVAPAAPTNLVATANGMNSIVLTWDAVEGATDYYVYKGGQMWANTSGATTYTENGLTMGTEYCFAVQAVAELESELSETVCATTESLPENQILIGESTTKFYSPFLTILGGGSWFEAIYTSEEIGKACNIGELAFSYKDGNETNADINIYLAETTKDEYASPADFTAETDLTLVYSGTGITLCDEAWETFVLDTPFNYSGENNLIVVVATNNTGLANNWNCYEDQNRVLIKDLGLDTHKPVMLLTTVELEPAVPANLTAEALSASEIKLTWDAAENALSYNVYNGDEVVANVTETTYTVAGLEAYTEYSFTVTAVRNEQESEKSATATAKTLDLAVAVPANLTAEALSASEIKLTWDAAENALSYNVYNGDEKLANVTETTYTVTGLEYNTEYSFTVTAVRNEQESEKSATATAKTLDLAVTVPANLTAEALSASEIKLTWDVAENALSYNVYNGDEKLANVTETTYTVTGLEAYTEYSFTVTAVRNEQESEKSATATAKTLDLAVAVPANLTAEALSTSEIKLTWDVAENALSYNVYNGDEKLANVTETTYTVTGLEYNTEYTFTVTAVRNEQESEKAEVVAKTLGEGIAEMTSSIDIYPNPVENRLFIATESVVEEISIYTMTGVMIYGEKDYNNNTIDVSNLDGGVYIIKVITNEGGIVKRFIKK